MDQTETYKIVMMIEGEEKAKRLADETAKVEKNIKALKDSYAQGNVTAAVYNKELASLTSTQSKLNREVENAIKSYQRLQTVQAQTNAAASGGTDALTRYGTALSQLGYIADDAQYGIRGLVNNIQPLAAGLGLGSGIAGVVGLVAIAASQLYQNWDQVAKLWDGGASERETKRLEGLKKTAEEYAKIIKGIAENPGAEASSRKATAATAIGAIPGGVALKEVMAALADEDKKTNFRSERPLQRRAEVLLANAQQGKNGGPEFLSDLFGPGTKRSDSTALGRAFQNATNTALQGEYVSPEEEKKRSMAAMVERGRIENEKDAAAAADLKKKTFDWMADEDRVGKNRDRNEAKEINDDKASRRSKSRDRREEVSGTNAEDMVRRSMLQVGMQGGTEGQMMARGQRMFMQQGMSIEDANAAAKQVMKQRVDPADNPMNAMAEQRKAMFGPREIISGAASFKDRVMSSGGPGNDPATKQLSELQKSSKSLEQLVQLIQNRTFPAVAS